MRQILKAFEEVYEQGSEQGNENEEAKPPVEPQVEEPGWWAIKEEEIPVESEYFEDHPQAEVSEISSPSTSEEEAEVEEKDQRTPDFILKLIHDSWQGPNNKGEIFHLNKTGRKTRIDPRKEDCPVPVEQLDGKRITVKTRQEKPRIREEDDWRWEKDEEEEMWTGLTVFHLKKEYIPSEVEDVKEREREEY